MGSHPSGRIGEDPNGIPNNLMPYVAQVRLHPSLQYNCQNVILCDIPTSDTLIDQSRLPCFLLVDNI